MNQPFPTEGQYFTIAPPVPSRSPLPWLLPLGLGTITTLLLVLSFGLSAPTPSPAKSPQPAIPPTPKTTNLSIEPSPPTEPSSSNPQNVPASVGGGPGMTIAQIDSPGLVVNFRVAPTFNSQIQGVIPHGERIEVSGQPVLQDGVIWQEIRYRKQFGWVARQFIAGRP